MMRRNVDLLTLGDRTHECHWTFCPDGLNAQSIVYSGGVGSDITFEHALVKQFGCEVVLYDPSPTGVRTMALSENQISQFHFHQVALAGKCGTLKMAEPRPGDDSWSARSDDTATLEVPTTDLLTLMHQHGHTHVDLLKMDIEGSEYEVIDDILRRAIPIRQICVEFHHSNLPGIKRSQTLRAMFKLFRAGYRLIDQTGTNHTFLKA